VALFLWVNSPSGLKPPLSQGFTITFIHTTLRRTPLDRWSASRRDPYLTTHTKDRHPCPLMRFKSATTASKWWQTHALEHAPWDQPFLHLVDIKYSSRLSLTVPMYDNSKRLFIGCVIYRWIRYLKDKLEVRISNIQKCGMYESWMSESLAPPQCSVRKNTEL
jgi:hypothetical protein